MADRERVIKALEVCIPLDEGENCPTECPYYQDVCSGYSQVMRDALELLKEQEEQKQKWLKQIADAQIAVCPTGNETEEGFAKRTGEWNGLQMAWDILTKGR